MNITAERITNPSGKTAYVLKVDGEVIGNQIETNIKSTPEGGDEFTVTFSGRMDKDGIINLNRLGQR